MPMETFKIDELMVPLSEYATVDEDATLLDAVMALEKAQREWDQTRYRHRAVVVIAKGGRVVGKVSQLDILRALEPKYDDIYDSHKANIGGFSRKFMKHMLHQFELWDSPLQEVCKKAANRKVKDFMYSPTEAEFVDAHAGLDEAIHQLVMGHHQSLLVVRDKQIVGVLRLTDVFAAVFQIMKQCRI
jgi:CBS domain-containing protein